MCKRTPKGHPPAHSTQSRGWDRTRPSPVAGKQSKQTPLCPHKPTCSGPHVVQHHTTKSVQHNRPWTHQRNHPDTIAKATQPTPTTRLKLRRQTNNFTCNGEKPLDDCEESKSTHPNSADTIPLGPHTTDRQEDHAGKTSTLPTAHTRTLTTPLHAHHHEEEMKTNHRLAHFCLLRKEKREGRKRVSKAGGAAAASATASVENASPPPPRKKERDKERRAVQRAGGKREEIAGGFLGRLQAAVP